jgi:hypothetical protein
MPTLSETESPPAASTAETAAPGAPAPQPPSRVSALFTSEPARLAAAIALYSLPALLFIRAFYIVDPDVWWHLRAGQWILQHRAVPVTDPFSSYGADKPWIVYSWLFDTIMATMFARFGLVSIAFYEIGVRVVLTAALFHMVRNLLPGFWRPAALTAAAIFTMTQILGPRPGMLTILLVIVLFEILVSAQRTGRTRLLWLLPPLFALWANWHIQFVYGLFVLGVFAGEPLLNALFRYRSRPESALPPAAAGLALAASAAATLLNPYGVKIYSTVFLYAGQTRVYNLISEFLAMNFRQPQHYVAVLLVLGAAMAIGWRRDLRPLWLILLLTASLLAFRSVREIWFLAVVSVCAIADGWRPTRSAAPPAATPLRSRAMVGIWVVAIIIAACRHYGLSNDALEVQTAGAFPEAAVRYIELHHLPGPLFNDLSWGGYLVWRLPALPVALDGRTNVYGEDRILRFSDVWKGKPGWESDPDLNRANLVLTPRDAAIASLLRTSSQFRNVYEDSQAVIFQRR